MIRPTVLRNSAEPEIVIGIALKIFYQADDWVDNSTFLDRLDEEYDAINKTRESRNGGQAIAKYKPALYYGLIDVNENGAHRINDYGRLYYEAYIANNEEDRVDCLISSISTHKFGSDNPAVPESRSRIEPPKVFLVSCLLLNNKLSKTEYAYILEQLSNDRDYQKILVDVSLARLKGSDLSISDYAKNNYRDDKGLKFLSDAGFFDDIERGTKAIKEKYLIKYSDVLSSLSVLSDKETGAKSTISLITNLKHNNNTMYHNYLAAIRTKPFLLLAGISGTGKSRIVRKLAQASVTEELQRKYDPNSVVNGFNRWRLHKPANFELIQVKPNWHNSMEVVGYKSNIGSVHYEFTPFVEFVARAWLHQDVPFFLCLDEMNLAPVEQYFAEFLSAIESRTIENGKYITDPIVKPFESYDTKDKDGIVIDCLSDRMIAKLIGALDTQEKSNLANHFKTKGLTLPKNLIIMGTVNMDETTFTFSRKVLDRAMSIEMNTVDFNSFFDGTSENDVPEMDSNTIDLLIERPLRGIDEDVTTSDQKDDVREFFENLNSEDLLGKTPFKLGYRAINEALLFVSANKMFGQEDTQKALNQFALMKILSRIEGDKRSIGDLLEKLKSIFPEGTDAGDKLKQMADMLEQKQFVSYWT